MHMCRWLLRVAVSLALLAFVAPTCAPAQTITTSSNAIRGNVTRDGAAIRGAEVAISGPVIQTSVTLVDGSFNFINLSPGLYTITVKARGFATVTRGNILVAEGETVVNVDLAPPAAGSGPREIAHVTVSNGGKFNVTPASVDVVSAQTLQEADQPSVRETLQNVPGVTVSRSSLYSGNASTVFDNILFASVRGGEPYETGTLLDGHPMYGLSSSAGFSIGWIPSEFLSGIDVVKGPGATTPSISNAINGTVNFVTLDPHAKPGAIFGAESDGFGGTIVRFKAATRLTSKLSVALGYQQWESPGPSNGTPELFIVGKNNVNLINGAAFSNCVATNCQFTPSPNASRYYSPGSLQPYAVQGLGCCSIDQTAYSSRSQLVKMRYDVSPNLYVEGGYIGNQTFQEIPQNLGTFLFQPGAGYTGSVRPGPVTAVYGYGGETTAPTSGPAHNTAFTFDLVGQLGNVVLSAKAIQVNLMQLYSNGLPLLGKDSVSNATVPVTLYGSIASGAPATYTTYNVTSATYTPGLGAYRDDYGSNLGGITLQADMPVRNGAYTIAFDQTRYSALVYSAYGYTGTDIISN